MRAVWVSAGVGLLMVLPLWAADPVVGSPFPAVWKEQRLEFSYVGRTARYSCQGLRDKVRSLLLDLGARRDLTVSVLACNEAASGSGGSSLGPNLGIAFSSPAMPDPAPAKPSSGDSPPVDARFMPFTLSSDVFRNL